MTNTIMGKIQRFRLLILIGLPVFLFVSGCKKEKSEYYDFELQVTAFDGNALNYLESGSGKFDSLLLVIDMFPALKDSLRTQKLSVFAPVNSSFKEALRELNTVKFQEGEAPVALHDLDKGDLRTLVGRYFLEKKYTTDDYKESSDGFQAVSLDDGYLMSVQYLALDASGLSAAGPQVLFLTDTKGSIFDTDWVAAATSAVNIYTDNAVVNVLTPDHTFGFGEFSDKFK